MIPVVIVNPRAGGGRAGREWPALSEGLAVAVGRFDRAFTSAPLDATRLAADAARQGRPLVVAVGGDGTVNEVVDGLRAVAAAPDALPELAIVMIGTGADLARTLSLPSTAADQVSRAGQPRVRVIDAGRADYVDDASAPRSRHFVNVGGFGLSGATDRVVNARGWLRVFGARAAFQVGVARALLSWRNQPVAISVDGAPEFTVTAKLGAVANGCWFGGGMRIAPQAVIDDGLLEVVVVGDVSAATLVRRLPMVYRGEHVALPEVRVLRGREVRVRPIGSAPVPLDLDGESPGHLPATFSVVPRALRIRA